MRLKLNSKVSVILILLILTAIFITYMSYNNSILKPDTKVDKLEISSYLEIDGELVNYEVITEEGELLTNSKESDVVYNWGKLLEPGGTAYIEVKVNGGLPYEYECKSLDVLSYYIDKYYTSYKGTKEILEITNMYVFLMTDRYILYYNRFSESLQIIERGV